MSKSRSIEEVGNRRHIVLIGAETEDLPRDLERKLSAARISVVNPEFTTHTEGRVHYIGDIIQNIGIYGIPPADFIFSSGLFNEEFRPFIHGRGSYKDIYVDMLSAVKVIAAADVELLIAAGIEVNPDLEAAFVETFGWKAQNIGPAGTYFYYRSVFAETALPPGEVSSPVRPQGVEDEVVVGKLKLGPDSVLRVVMAAFIDKDNGSKYKHDEPHDRKGYDQILIHDVHSFLPPIYRPSIKAIKAIAEPIKKIRISKGKLLKKLRTSTVPSISFPISKAVLRKSSSWFLLSSFTIKTITRVFLFVNGDSSREEAHTTRGSSPTSSVIHRPSLQSASSPLAKPGAASPAKGGALAGEGKKRRGCFIPGGRGRFIPPFKGFQEKRIVEQIGDCRQAAGLAQEGREVLL